MLENKVFEGIKCLLFYYKVLISKESFCLKKSSTFAGN